MDDFFKECNIHIIPLGLGLKRLTLFKSQIKKHGGAVTDQLNNETFPTITHIAVEAESANIVAKDIVEQFKNTCHIKIVKVEWICECLKTKSKVQEKRFEVALPTSTTIKRKSEILNTSSQSEAKKSLTSNVNINDYTCAHASAAPQTIQMGSNTNEAIINELQKLADAFKNRGDQWRNYAYTKAIAAIKCHGKEIKTYEEAIAIPGLGDKMASKVWELLETGGLRRTQEICEGEHAKTLELFMGVWGAGATTAQQWYAQGFRTLADLETKATLTNQQKIGLKYYHDIQERIPREEVAEIAKIVECEAQALCPDVQVEVCGSYRRGKATCGDIDILIVHPREDISKTSFLSSLVQRLQVMDFITENLVNIDEHGTHRKYFGLCRLQGLGHKHRRLDLFVVPWGERGPALLHYTGSALFNRSMRLLAQKKGMSLTEHALHAVAFRQGREKLSTGPPLFTPKEEDVFKYLELPYRLPEERDH